MKYLISLLTCILFMNGIYSQSIPDLTDTTQNFPNGVLKLCTEFYNPTNTTPSHTFTAFQVRLIYAEHPFIDNDFPATYGVKLYSILYETTHANGDTTLASGALIVPIDAGCDLPLAIFCKGTVLKPERAPSGFTNLDPYLFDGFTLAANGFVTVVPDYLGYGIDADTSSFHPYVHAPTEASTSIDIMRAAQDFIAANENADLNLNGDVFIFGHSQGGHTALSIQKELEKNEDGIYNASFPDGVTATATISGIFDLSNILLYDVILSDDPKFFQARVINLLMSYRQIYKEKFDNKPIYYCPECDTSEYQDMRMIFSKPVNDWINHYQYKLQNTPFDKISFMQLSNLYANEELQCYLNGYEVVNLQCTGNNLEAQSTKDLFQPAFLRILRTDTAHPLIQAMKENDLYDGWAPKAPIKFYYCVGDDILSTQSTKAEYFLTHRQKETPGQPLNIESIRTDGPDENNHVILLNHAQCQIPSIKEAYSFFKRKSKMPFNFTVSQPDTMDVGERNATLIWEDIPNILDYNIRYKTTTSPGWAYIVGISHTQNSYYMDPLLPGTRYEWQILATSNNLAGCNLWSPLSVFMTKCPPPDTVSTQVNSSTSATFFWSQVPDAVKYEISGGLASNSTVSFVVGDPSISSYTATGLLTNNLYNWKVRTICHHSESKHTDKNYFALSASSLKTGGNKVSQSITDLAEIYPNPANDVLLISFKKNDELRTISLYDQQGKLITHAKCNGPLFKMNIKDMSSGTYQLVIEGTHQKQVQQVSIVQ